MLLEKLKADQLAARKEKNSLAASLLTTLYSESVNVGKNKENRISTDDEVIAMVKKFIKSANENKDIYTKSANQEKIAVIEAELNILNRYLPQSLSEGDVLVACEKISQELCLDKSPASLGKLMKELKSRYGSQLDGASASVTIKKFLGN